MKIGTCTQIANYEAVCSIGYDYIELEGLAVAAMDNAQFASTLNQVKNGPIPCVGFNSFAPATIKIAGPEYDRSKACEHAKLVIDRAAQLGCKTVGIGSPGARNLPQGYPYEKGVADYTQFSADCADLAKSYGIWVLAEAVCSGMTNLINTTKEALAVVQQLNRDNVGLTLDLYHFVYEKESITEIPQYVPYVKHAHIANFSNRGQLVEAHYNEYKALISELKRCGYNGTISVESGPFHVEREAPVSLKILRSIDRETSK